MKLHKFLNKFQIAISIFVHIKTICTKPISVPVVWPDSSGTNTNRQSQSNRRIETINERPNSDFNRLVFNRVGHNLQNSNSQDYVDYVDKPERLTNNFAVQGGSPSSEQNNGRNKLVFDDVESRTKFLFKKKFKKKKKKICLPIGYGHGKADSLRTLYDINVIFADVNLNQYDTYGGYGCKPFHGLNSGHGSVQGGLGGHGTHGSHGSQHGGSHHGGSNYESHTDTDTDNDDDDDDDYINQNDHGSLIQTDDYNHENSDSSQGSQGNHNLFGGLFHGTTNTNNNNNHGSGYAGGGPLGFFGQGGLFDFSNNGGQRPQTSGTLADSIGDTVKPVIEINVPDTIQDVIQGNWRPGNLVGGVQNTVSGFIQDISSRPGEAIRQINREISSIFRSFTDLF